MYLGTHLIVQAAVEMAGSSSSIAESWQNGNPFSLGMDDWMDSPPPPQQRFAAPVTLEKLKDFSKGAVPKNTTKNYHWALNNFYSWLQQHSKQQPEDPCPTDILLTKEPELLIKWLSLFVLETRN